VREQIEANSVSRMEMDLFQWNNSCQGLNLVEWLATDLEAGGSTLTQVWIEFCLPCSLSRWKLPGPFGPQCVHMWCKTFNVFFANSARWFSLACRMPLYSQEFDIQDRCHCNFGLDSVPQRSPIWAFLC
jgi:hypothetical protein